MFPETIDPQSRFFDWSTDSRHLLILAQANYLDDGLWLVDTDTWEHTALAVPGIGSIRGGAISPDGQRVIYSWRKDSSDPREVWMVNADGRDARLLFTVNGYAAKFSWSPDGSKVFIDRDSLMIMDVNSEQVQKIDTSCVPIHYAPQWSPDSRFLAIMRDTDDTFIDPWGLDAFQGANICLVDVEKSVSRPLLDDKSEGNMYPAWSPDGSKIAFVSNRSGKSEVWVVNVDGSDLHQLTHTEGEVRFPIWVRP